MNLASFDLRPSSTMAGYFILTTTDASHLDDESDVQAFAAADLEQLRALIDQVLPRHEHNTDATDPMGHVLFDSVCCGAKLYRHTPVVAPDALPVPTKPIIHNGETQCRECGADLAQF